MDILILVSTGVLKIKKPISNVVVGKQTDRQTGAPVEVPPILKNYEN